MPVQALECVQRVGIIGLLTFAVKMVVLQEW